jgi:hypothetical protein
MPGDIFTVQSPNGGLTTNTVNDAAYGLLTTTFDWGSAGHTLERQDREDVRGAGIAQYQFRA